MAELDAAVTPLDVGVSDMRLPGLPLVSANPHFVRLFGLRSDADAVGRNCRFTQGPRTQMYLIEELSAALRGALSCVVRILNYAAGGRCFHTLVVLHPVFETVGGPHRFMLGLQIEFDFGDDEGVIERIVALERTLALMPRTLDGSHEADRQRVAGASLLRRGEAGSAGGGAAASVSVEARCARAIAAFTKLRGGATRPR